LYLSLEASYTPVAFTDTVVDELLSYISPLSPRFHHIPHNGHERKNHDEGLQGSTRKSMPSITSITSPRSIPNTPQPSTLRPIVINATRSYASSSEPSLKDTMKAVIPAKRELLKKVKAHSSTVIGEVKIENTLGGMRGLKAMVWEGSVLDANEGIRFHGRTIKECQAELPKGTSGTEMLPEAMFWLLLTGEVPTVGQTRQFSRELAEQGQLPDFVNSLLDSLPKDLHPMTQFAIAVSALNHTSSFAKAYEAGINKADYWEPTFDDSISLLAKLPTIAAKIYQNAYNGGGALPAEIDTAQDWSYNFAAMLGRGGEKHEDFQDLLRLYLALHGDHEGGNVSAHATHLVGSALSDPFLSYSAGLQGLAGPLHGFVSPPLPPFLLNTSYP
jgi:citrate synthase